MTTQLTTAQIAAWNAQQDRRVADIIREHGCFIQAVMGEQRTPPFAYTVGLFGLGHPELIVFGLDHVSAGVVLNWFFDHVRGGEELTPGEIVQPPGADDRFLVEAFPDPWTLYAANRHYRRRRGAPVQAYQLTWAVNGGSLRRWLPNAEWLQPRPGQHVVQR